MQKYIIIILILVLLSAPFISHALPPVWVDNGDSGDVGSGTGSGTGTGTGRTNNVPSPFLLKEKLFVETGDFSDVTYTTATLNGIGGYTISSPALPLPTFPITAYFRYSKAKISPIFCNDIYGTNMISTKDIKLNVNSSISSESFRQLISNLIPDTTYYYCAIVSNKDGIAYGEGNTTVKSFHTSPLGTTIRTMGATNINSTSAVLNGSFSSLDTTTTYFQYREASTSGTPTDWGNNQFGKVEHVKVNSNVYGNISYSLDKLTKNTRYQFRAVATTKTGTEVKTFYGSTLNFTTSATETGDDDNTNPYTPRTPTCRPPYIFSTTTNTCIAPGLTGTCPTGWTGIYPSCIAPETTGTCRNNAVNYPLCTINKDGNCVNGLTNPPTCIKNTGIWVDKGGDGTTGTWGSGDGFGTWTATTGRGGVGVVTWYGTGNGTGTWSSATGSGTWTNGTGKGGAGSGTWNNLALGQIASPPSDAIVRYHEGIETVFTRQIIANQTLAQIYGYVAGTDLQTFAWNLSDQLARMFGYVDPSGKEIRVSFPDVAAYQLLLMGNTLTVYEYYNNRIVDVRNINTAFKNASDYEYYFKK